MRPCCASHDPKQSAAAADNASVSVSCSVNNRCPSTTVDDNFRSSRASSQASIPALDWDEQGETADLVSLSDLPLEEEEAEAVVPCCHQEAEAEMLICQIEQLTSRYKEHHFSYHVSLATLLQKTKNIKNTK